MSLHRRLFESTVFAWLTLTLPTFAAPLAFIPGNFGFEVVSDSVGNRLFASRQGIVTAYDYTSGAVLDSNFAIGTAFDVSPDGKKLLTVQPMQSSQIVRVYDLESREYNDYEISVAAIGRLSDVVFVDDRTLLALTEIGGPNQTQLQIFDLASGAISVLDGFVFNQGILRTSVDRSVTVLYEWNYAFSYYDAATESVRTGGGAEHDVAANRDGTRFAEASVNTVEIYDKSFSKVGSIAADDEGRYAYSVVYSPVADVLFVSTSHTDSNLK